MFAKIEIKGKIKLETGMHIGGSTQFAAIGAIDSPVIRDSFTDLPMIPGSSFKGKLRTLLAKKYNTKLVEPDNDDQKIKRLFGSSKKGEIKSSRLIFSDSILSNDDDLKDIGVSSTEIKTENTINRITAIANPRQIERAVRGSIFDFSIIYNAEEEKEIKEDIELLKEGLKFLEYDYIGGHGSRGYGRVKIEDLNLDVVVGKIDNKIKEDCKKILEG
ncbi:type III-A CRISPR-associated RAMP protein Csm3 [Peptacetobacter sp.]|uniref:type III-A CRISPR-associated RAMP protein Csm3 n=1 Tax=Peptacetobacter sp. TaxID=2991975 RepID=UPI00260BD2A1|nr:type III-A CRISPR-associated RAMP protein Csm3 [Peptacetobacter sp.]